MNGHLKTALHEILTKKLHTLPLFPTAITSILADICPMLGTLYAAIKLHNSLLNGIIRAPVLFFDTTPLGRILARFSKDVEELDNDLPMVVVDGVYCLLEVSLLIG